MKRSPLVRRKGLCRSLPLQGYRDTDPAPFAAPGPCQGPATPGLRRRTPIRQQSTRARRHAAEWRVAREVAYRRSGGWCEVCGTAITRDAYEAHHRKLRSQGGDDRPENLLALCPGPAGCHHARVHGGDRAAVEAAGWIVRRADDPATVPALVAGHGPVLLTAIGYVPTRGAA